ncbi:2-oxoglutarate-dependent dioxygenase DAO-like isoform X1 [Andrographis paniculata]|uniref:2-oxoglutarate-dependent dioxygenase DAO-like isoform X1 n=1 Tax=Andrographis paniculata TaxID=175694 RepID=UPI0021E6E27F|nr:2-oxoglutarate-dependent dioxygenase DAO-like isoform X1 [Andrographis paniculata]
MSSIPVIDLISGAGKDLIGACEEWGCFRIVNFQEILEDSLLREMKAVVRSLLDLPAAVKSRNRDVIAGSGYMAPSETNPHYEALGLFDMASPPDVQAFCSNLEATPYQRDTILKYAKKVNQVMREIVLKIGQGLGINDVPNLDDWSCQFRINKYNFSSETMGCRGVQLHTDSSFLTLLQDDEKFGGLEIMKRNGEFHAVEPCPGTLLVNLGDLATVWSNGKFLNVKHRVICKEVGIRVSIASFLLGPNDEKIVAPPELVDLEHPRMYVPFTFRELRNLRMSEKLHIGEALRYYLCK